MKKTVLVATACLAMALTGCGNKVDRAATKKVIAAELKKNTELSDADQTCVINAIDNYSDAELVAMDKEFSKSAGTATSAVGLKYQADTQKCIRPTLTADIMKELKGSSGAPAMSAPEPGVDAHPRCSHKTGQRRDAAPNEKLCVAQLALQPPGPHAGQHHPQCHEAGAQRVVRRLVDGRAVPVPIRTPGHHQHEHHVRGEAEAIAKLFHRQRRAHEPDAGGLNGRQQHKKQVRRVHGHHQRPQQFLQAPA